MKDQVRRSLEKILAASEQDKLGAVNDYGGCMYKNEAGQYCAIGCLLSEEHILALDNQGLISCGINEMNDYFPDMLKEDTGFTTEQAQAIQSWHDECFDETATITKNAFENMLRELLAGYYTTIRSTPSPYTHVNPTMVSFSDEEKEEVQA